MFQSAWSGADYQPDKDESTAEDLTVYAINDLGQYDILSEDLSGLENADEVKTVPTELDAIIDGIQAITEKAGIEAFPRPWLPPLAARNYLPLLDPVSYQEAWATENKGELVPVIGIADIPTMQAQETLSLNLSKEGHMAVYSSPAFGKSTFLQTIMMGLARKHNPERLHAYLLDFGTNGLLPLRSLPHIADTMNSDEDEKIGKFIRRMATEIKRRKKMLSQYAVANLAMYEKASGNEEPSILILVDGYEGFKGMKYEDPLEKILTQISREGAGVGLHLIISAGRTASMRANLQSNIKLQLALKMIDDAEPRNIVGRTSLAIDDLPGRGLIKLEDPALFQAALPTEGEETLDIIDAIQAEAKEMDAYWTGERPEEIPMIPEVLDFEEFVAKKATKELIENEMLPIGLDFENVEPLSIDFSESPHVALVGVDKKTFLPLKKGFGKLIGQMKENYMTMIIDPDEICLDDNPTVNAYLSKQESIEGVKANLIQEIEQRAETLGASSPKWLVYITNIEEFEKMTKLSEDEAKILLGLGSERGVHFIIAGDHQYLAKTRTGIPKYIKETIQTSLITMRLTDQDYAESPYLSREPELEMTSANYSFDKQFIKVKYPV
ncbi:FtsK/SpoIIIE domain-containing protein [Carnobacterium maltaromaticum]